MDNKYPQGFIVKSKHENAPDFIKANIAIKVAEFIPYLNQNVKNGWVNIQIKESKSGRLYAELDTFERKKDVEEVKEEIRDIVHPEDTTTSETDEGEVIDASEIPF